MGGDAALSCNGGLWDCTGRRSRPTPQNIGGQLTSSVARGRMPYTACPTSAATASGSSDFQVGSPMVSLVSRR